MAYKDYYKLLGVPESANADDIKKAYRKLAKKYHPDTNPGDDAVADKFKDINEAHETLSDTGKRRQYDDLRRFGGAGYQGFHPGGPGGGGPQPFDFQDLFRQARGGGRRPGPGGATFRTQNVEGFGDLGDMLSSIFGGGAGRARGFRPQKGRDHHAEVEVPFDTAAGGGSTVITLARAAGGGQAPQTTRLSVKIPSGIDDGGKIRLRGQGEPGIAGGPPGDLIIKINVAGDGFFRRKGANVYCDIKINLSQAVLGSKIKVRTLAGKHAILKIPDGTQPGTTFKLKGMGIKRDGKQGDQFVTVSVEIPTDLTPEEKKLFERYQEGRKK